MEEVSSSESTSSSYSDGDQVEEDDDESTVIENEPVGMSKPQESAQGYSVANLRSERATLAVLQQTVKQLNEGLAGDRSQIVRTAFAISDRMTRLVTTMMNSIERLGLVMIENIQCTSPADPVYQVLVSQFIEKVYLHKLALEVVMKILQRVLEVENNLDYSDLETL